MDGQDVIFSPTFCYRDQFISRIIFMLDIIAPRQQLIIYETLSFAFVACTTTLTDAEAHCRRVD